MAENEFTPDVENKAAFKEAVCVDAMRIYDSCSEKEYASLRSIGLTDGLSSL